MPVSQDDIRSYLGTNNDVHVQIASPDDGSPETAWGDTFFSVRKKDGTLSKMPFTTIVTKDYEGFDCDSNLNRGDLFRLNIEVGKEKFKALFHFAPREFDEHRGKFDFASLNQLFPHPAYATYGWVSIINPDDDSMVAINELLDYSLTRALRQLAE